MFEVAWQEIGRNDRVVTKRRTFKTEAALERFVSKLEQKDSFLRIIAYR